MKILRMTLLFIAFITAFAIQFSDAAAEEKIIAVSDSFKITEADIKHLEEFMKKRGFTTTKEELFKAVVKVRLFAEEALRLNLSRRDEKSEQLTIDEIMKFQFDYMNRLLEEYPLTNAAIESYYYSNPHHFQKCDDDACTSFHIIPLDDEVEKAIRNRIINAKRNRIVDNTYQDLLEKYNVRFCDQAGGC